MKSTLILTILALVICSSTVFAQQCGPKASKNFTPKCTCFGGYYGTQEEADTVGCKPCPNNTFSKSLNTIGGLEKCNLCTKGFYVSAEATDGKSALCSECPDNQTTEEVSQFSDGKQICTYLCKEGYYNENQGGSKEQIQCQRCPDHSTTLNDTSFRTGINYCGFCEAGYYRKDWSEDGYKTQCAMCPKNSTIKPKNQGKIDDCKCDDPFASIQDGECKCNKDFEGQASPQSPCKPIKPIKTPEVETKSSGNILKVLLVPFALLVLSV